MNIQITTRHTSFEGCITGLREIHGDVQNKFHDQWDWINADFYVEAASAHYAKAEQALADREHYTSTACHHESHTECRKTCKFCSSPCKCPCHVKESE